MTSFTPKRFWTCVFAFFIGSAVTSQAFLTLHIDQVAEELYFSGSDSGLTNSSGDVSWESGAIPGATYDLDILSALDLTGLTSPTGTMYFEASGDDVSLLVNGTTFASTAFTVSGNGTRISFASLISSEKSEFYEILSMPLAQGSGASTITVSSVPEPSAYAAFFGIAALVLAGIRRRRV